MMLLFACICVLPVVCFLTASASNSSTRATAVPQSTQTAPVQQTSAATAVTDVSQAPARFNETTTVMTPQPVQIFLPEPSSLDFVVQYYDINVSMQDLLVKLNMTFAPFDVKNICLSPRFSCELVCPLGGNENQERRSEKACYCDKLCVEVGDCCYDYFSRCASGSHRRTDTRHKCVKTTNEETHYGYVMIDRCPSNNHDKELESLCTATASNDHDELQKILPVSDLDNDNVYRNVFCARCNGVGNQGYWKFSARCENLQAHDLPRNRSLMLAFILNNCKWSFKESSDNYQYMKLCLKLEQKCSDQVIVQIEPLLPELCSFYAFPNCDSVRKKNPHCEICQGFDFSIHDCNCFDLEVRSVCAIPSLDILFDFSLPSSHSVKVGDETTVVKNKACSDGGLYDPFAEMCVQLHKPGSFVNETLMMSCNGSEFVKLNVSLTTLFANGSMWIPLYKRIYQNGSYFINGTSVFVCMNLTKNYTETHQVTSTEETTITIRQIITYTGCTISMMSLILLLGIYITFSELRTLPGKNLMSLSSVMLLYHTMFLMTGQKNHPYLCKAVAVLLHYVLLSSFCWMNVMAFDVAKTFGRKGQSVRFSCSGDSKAALVKYSVFAWATPAVIVTISVILDETDTIFIGYGSNSCWISNGKALLVVLGVPVALILVFNCAALSFTLFSIWKVQKSTQRVAEQSRRTSLPILYIKLSSALGFTWLLGFIVPFAQVEFVTYLFVIFNSLQGFFIFLAFVANRRMFSKVKGLYMSKRTSNIGGNKTPRV